MIKIYSNEDRFLVTRVKEMLDEHGIPCFLKNEYSIGGVGELSPFDAWPEVWLSDEEWQPRAARLIDELQMSPTDSSDWHCSECGEQNDASFKICWHCQHQQNNP